MKNATNTGTKLGYPLADVTSIFRLRFISPIQYLELSSTCIFVTLIS